MKKVIYVFFVCLIILSIAFYFYINKDDAKGIVKKLNNFYEELFGEKLEVYDENFVIHEKHQKGSYIIKNILNPDDPKLHLVHGNRLKLFVQPHVNWEHIHSLIAN